MEELIVQYSSSTAWASGVIRRLCHSPFSHVDIVLPEGLLGASGKDDSLKDIGGVLIRPFNPWPYRVKVQVKIPCTLDIYNKVISNAKGQLGKPFDNAALWDFLGEGKESNRDWRSLDSWFCSELFIWSMEEAGFFPYPLAVCKNRVSPADSLIMLNPYMSKESVEEVLKVYDNG